MIGVLFMLSMISHIMMHNNKVVSTQPIQRRLKVEVSIDGHLNEENSMTNTKETKETKTNTDSEMIGNETITHIVQDARLLWKSGQDNRMKLGEKFSQLYHEVERYKQSNKTGLTYTGAVIRTGVPRSTAERLRQMAEVKNEFMIPGDAFLVLAEEGVNLADIKAEMKEAFKGFLNTWLPKIRSLDITNVGAVKKLAEEILPKPPAKVDLAELKENLAQLMDDLQKAQTVPERISISDEIQQTREQIGAIYVARMKPLVTALALFLDWSEERVRAYVKAFGQQPLSQRTRLYEEAAKFATSAAASLAITEKVAA
jgi:hypothetical protein